MLRIAYFVIVVLSHHDGKEPTDRLAPPGWTGNAWGPEATKARERGEIPPIVLSANMKKWDDWGRTVLRDGDIVFRRGDARILFGYFPFSQFIAQASGSEYSHTGVVAIENGGPVVYDTTKAGVRRQPFTVWVLDNTGPIGVKRLKPDMRDKISSITAWCRKVYADQVPFDYELGLDDKALYCVEMTEKAYRSVGLPLSLPIRLGDMENAGKYPIRMFLIQALSAIALDEPLSPEQQVYFPGNDRHGIWASPYLETVYPPVPVADSRSQKPAARRQEPGGVRGVTHVSASER